MLAFLLLEKKVKNNLICLHQKMQYAYNKSSTNKRIHGPEKVPSKPIRTYVCVPYQKVSPRVSSII